ncbi:alkene reductase [Brevibacterium epidermidis]|uniref:alkene reductase n=1 Tax=Brevibacterium epidermidis TaxID=1698 RepID=UPI0007847F45|nr:alkene reductase [Brevibacterium epidermidis]
MSTANRLFEPFTLGGQKLANRMVLPPLTRSRATDEGLATDLMADYYRQRSGAGLIIAEGTVVLPQATAYPRVPGLYNAAQVEAWKPVVAAAKHDGNAMYCQLWHVGRQSHSTVQPDGLPPKAPSPVPITGFKYRSPDGPVAYETPREMSEADIQEAATAFGAAARNAMIAGFDGVELHGANGYLIEQFLDDGINRRTDSYGGSIENRMRFLREVLSAVFDHVPPHRVGVRLSPSSTWMDAIDSDKRRLFGTVINRLNEFGLAYLHLVEPGIAGSSSAEVSAEAIPTADLAALFDGPVIVTGGHTPETADAVIENGTADLVGFGRLFIANPDLPRRFALGAPFGDVRKRGLYGGTAEGYTDYPELSAAEL